MSVLERYLREVDFRRFLNKLGLDDTEILTENIEYFTEKEAKKRDEIVKNYFSEVGITTIVNRVTENLQKLPRDSAILDVGAGTGFFTLKIAEKLADQGLSFYALDATPAMLTVLVKKLREYKQMPITPVLGIAERISESVDLSQERYESFGILLPAGFDAIISILMLHHCRNLSEVFRSIQKSMKYKGRLILVDLCKHAFKEFGEEMGDIHLGFEPDQIRSELREIFRIVSVERMSEACRCEESGRSADLFIALAQK